MAKKAQTFIGQVGNDCKLHFNDPCAFLKACSELRGLEVEITIDKRRNRRSTLENNYYWGVVLEIISDWTGYTPQEAHDALREKFLSKADGERGLVRIKSSAALTTVEFEEYLSKIRQWASEQGVFIPLPNEVIDLPKQ